jgi:hypothetical protein
MKPLERRERVCGVVEEGLRCTYMDMGLGCPQRGLTDLEATVRTESGIDDFCHWTHRAVFFGVAPSDVQERWMEPHARLVGHR